MRIRSLSVFSVLLGLGLQALASDSSQDPCLNAYALSRSSHCESFDICTQRERVLALCELRDAVLDKYAGVDLKPYLITEPDGSPFDPETHLNFCIERELAIQGEAPSLDYYDRVRECVAGFQDGHFMVKQQGDLYNVFLGLTLRRAPDGSYLIVSRIPAVLNYLEKANKVAGLSDTLKIGSKVLSIDGVPIQEIIADLGKYVFASSAAAREERALDAVTSRRFRYPAHPTAIITVLDHKNESRNFEIPWWIQTSAMFRPELYAAAVERGFPMSQDIMWKFDEQKQDWSKAEFEIEGYQSTDTLFPGDDLNPVEEYQADDEPVLRMGLVIESRESVFCSLQILSFDSERVKQKGASEDADFVEVVKKFISRCEDKHLDLVIDVRENGGGSISHAKQVLHALKRVGEPLPVSWVRTFRVSKEINQIIFQGLRQKEAPARELDQYDLSLLTRLLKEARLQGKSLTSFVTDSLDSDEFGLSAFSGRIVVLIAPNCASACELFAESLKVSGRALLVGQPTAGARIGYKSSDPFSEKWRDSSNLIAGVIPNTCGAAVSGLFRDGQVFELQDHLDWIRENRPVTPDMPYELTTSDYMHGFKDYSKAVIKALGSIAIEPSN